MKTRVGVIVSLLVAIATTLGAGNALAWGPPPDQAPTFRQDYISGMGMNAVKVRSWAAQGVDVTKAPTLVFLDGLRATDDVSGWERDTNVAYLSKRGYNVVMPVGGQSSFYADWNAPGTWGGQTYKWESVLTNSLPAYLTSRGFGNRTLVGLSMSGAQAVTIANEHRDLYQRVVSMSGMLNPTAKCPIPSMSTIDPITYGLSQLLPCTISMQTLLRFAAIDSGGYNLNNMWGTYPNDQSLQADPTVQTVKGNVSGLHIWVYAGNGVWANHQPQGEDQVNYMTTGLNSTTIEMLSKAQSLNFARIAALRGATVRESFPGAGTHAWGYWQDQIWYIASQGWFFNG